MTLATEPTDTPTPETHEHVSLLERWADNERMRHIPPLPWMIDKLDHDLRRRIDLLWNVYANDPHHAEIENEFRGLCRSIDRVGDVAKRSRVANHHHPPTEIGQRIRWSLNHSVSMLNAVEASTFGHRFPFQTFERSNAEPLWAAMLAVIEHVRRLTELLRVLDPSLDERLYEGLVTLQTPLDTRPLA